jgi:3-hydroxyacyl-CoA dehydrogenase
MTLESSRGAARQELRSRILVVTIDNAPVNALGVNVRRELLAAIEAAETDPAVEAVLLAGARRNFMGDADIRSRG